MALTGKAHADAVKRRPLTAETRVQSQSVTIWIFGKQSGTSRGLFLEYFDFSFSLSFYRFCPLQFLSEGREATPGNLQKTKIYAFAFVGEHWAMNFFRIACNSVAAYYRGSPVSNPGRSTWDLWWTKWQWDIFSCTLFSFALSVPLPPCTTLFVRLLQPIYNLTN